MTAARASPGVTGITLRLPRGLSRGNRAVFVLAGGRRLQPLRTGKRRVSIPFAGDGVRAAKVVWRGLRTNRRLRRITRIRLTFRDARNNITARAPRVRVRRR